VYLRGALGVEVQLSDYQQVQLNKSGVNLIRLFAGGGPIVWGARTTAPMDQVAWRYVNVRRLVLFIEHSLKRNLRWAVFEPNNQALWKRVDRTIREFLSRLWRDGALVGQTEDQAFKVQVDEELNTEATQKQGQLIIRVEVAPTQPAEFVIIELALSESGS
jgi:hypothetical protein